MNSEAREKVNIETFVVGPIQTNCYLVYDEESLKGILIDPGADDDAIRSFIESNNIEVLYTLNTHGHGDHIKGDSSFGFPIIIHELDEECLRDPVKNLSFQPEWGNESLEAHKKLKDGDVIEAGSLRLEVIHTPGHTPGGISVKCGDVLFSGDTLFFEGVGRTDLPGGSYEALKKSIKEKLFTLPEDTRVLPGHGPETTIGHEKKYNPFMD